ncbi:MAG: hypothetical protein AAFR67_07105 [Chloroflexota bacterium]
MQNTSEQTTTVPTQEETIAYRRCKMYERIAQGNRLAEIETQAKQKYPKQ